MSAVDPQQEVSDLKRKLRLIKNKLLDPTERNIRQAISMIDDTFATDEVQMNCSRFGITCTPPPMFAVPGYPFLTPISPITTPTVTADANVQTLAPPDLRAISTQTEDSGDHAFSKSALYNQTQANIELAIELLTETKSTLADRGKKRKVDSGYITRSKVNTPATAALSIPNITQPTPTGRPGLTHLQRVRRISESKPMTSNMLTNTERLAIGDGVRGKYTPAKDKKQETTAEKRQKISQFDFNCKYCRFSGESETELFYHDCILLPHIASPFFCCGTAYKHRGYYTRHRDMKHHKTNFD